MKGERRLAVKELREWIGRGAFGAVAVLLLGSSVRAQSSASYQIEEAVFNAGGRPRQGTALASASYRMTLDAIGESAVGTGMTGPSYRFDSAFVSAYPPPGEVRGDRFLDKRIYRWDNDRSVGWYEVYRGSLGSLPGGAYGICFASGLTVAKVTDSSFPASGQGTFYIATARNRLGEEGTKGFQSDGTQRANPSPCP